MQRLTEQRHLQPRPQAERQPHRQRQQWQQQQQIDARPAARHKAMGQRAAQQHRRRQQQRQRQYRQQILLDDRRQPDASHQPDHHRRQRAHHFDSRFDHSPQPRRHKVSGIDGAGQGQRDGEQHRVSRRLEGAEDHRHQAEFRLVAVFAGGGLPDIGRLRVVLVPHLAPQRTPGDVRIRVVERIALPALRALQQQAIAARRERHLPHLGAQTGIQQRLGLDRGE
ncbi:Uncharacterised protein [Acinetobacter baumannii]|nr:Uncharacterised protein [Acinetobacter baumannii]